MKDRQRKRRGGHESIAGDPAAEVLETLVDQFSDRYAFVRELIQNSLDAGSSRIDVRMSYADGVLEVAVEDDGEGMDREIIEGYLLVLFRSTKERDLTKIGKFGIGFVSLFAMDPFEVVVDTGRDAVWHRVVFDEKREYTLLRMDDPFEGTTVRVRVRRRKDEASEDCARVHEAAVRWCRFAEAEITTHAEGLPGGGWSDRSVRARFGVESPVKVEVQEDGWHAVIGPHPSDRPPAGFYNRGLTLWEGDEPLIPGVTFRLRDAGLEHTLTRDNVLRDEHFDASIEKLRQLAKRDLGNAVQSELAEAVGQGDLARVRRIYGALGPRVPWKWDEDAPIVPGAAGPLTLRKLRQEGPGLLGSLLAGPGKLLFARPGEWLGTAVALRGAAVVLADSHADPHVAWLARYFGRTVAAVAEAHALPRPVEADQAVQALLVACHPLLKHAGIDPIPRAAHRTGSALQGKLAFADEDGALWVFADHPLVGKLARIAPGLAAPLLVRGICADIGAHAPLDLLVGEALKAAR